MGPLANSSRGIAMSWKPNIRSKLSKAILLLLVLGVTLYLIQRVILIYYYVGDYYMGITGTGCILSINADQTFTLTYGAKLPTTFLKGQEFHGSYVLDKGFLKFYLDDIAFNEVSCLMSRYALVRWQGRTYLLPYEGGTDLERSQKQRNQFCERVQNGEEIKGERSGDILTFIDMNDLEQIDSSVGKSDRPRLLGLFSLCPK